MLQRSSRVLALILVLMCSLLGCPASDKNIKTASAVVTNILTVPPMRLWKRPFQRKLTT